LVGGDEEARRDDSNASGERGPIKLCKGHDEPNLPCAGSSSLHGLSGGQFSALWPLLQLGCAVLANT
jgi:hypothetical protein